MEEVMKYLCLMLAEPEAFERMSPDEDREFSRQCAAYDQELIVKGTFVDANALESVKQSITVRKRDGKVSTTDGPFAETKEHLCGYVLVEALDLNAALEIAANSPFAKLGGVEVRPVMDFSNG
jgi:hypothetical protein